MIQKITYDLQKGIIFFVILIAIPVGGIIYSAITIFWNHDNMKLNQLAIILAIFAVALLLIYFLCIRTYYNSEYIIDGKVLKCKMGVFKSSINIDQIKYITKGDYPAAGNRPALNLKGIKISYGSGYLIFLSPQNVEKFIYDLKTVNDKIVVR